MQRGHAFASFFFLSFFRIAVTVEVKTGTRRVIEYFLSPLLQYGSESLRER